MSRTPIRMCARCDAITDEPVLVAEVHADSGPGWNVYACQGCAPMFSDQTDPIHLPDILDRNRREAREQT